MTSILFTGGWIVAALICILLVTFLTFCLHIYLQHCKYDIFPTPKRASFFFGHIPILTEQQKKNGKAFAEVLNEWALQYEGRPFVVWFLHRPRIVIYNKESIRDVMIKYNLRKPPSMKRNLSQLFGVRFMKNGLFTETNHDDWKKKRQTANPSFYRSHLKTLIPDYNNSCEKLIKKLMQYSDGKTEVRMVDFFHRLTLDVIGKVAFDLDLKSIEDDSTSFPTAVSNCLKGLIFAFRNPFYQINPWTFALQREFAESAALLRETGRKCIKNRREAIAQGKTMPSDILSTMMKLLDLDSIQITDEDLLDDFVTFFIAGQETTANLLSFMTVEITQRQDVMNKLRDEINEVLGSRDYVEFDDLAKLQYMGQVLKETLRLYPPVPNVSRYTKDPIVLSGLQIPANTGVMIGIFASHRSPAHFEDPEKFNPDRWSPENAEKM